MDITGNAKNISLHKTCYNVFNVCKYIQTFTAVIVESCGPVVEDIVCTEGVAGGVDFLTAVSALPMTQEVMAENDMIGDVTHMVTGYHTRENSVGGYGTC